MAAPVAYIVIAFFRPRNRHSGASGALACQQGHSGLTRGGQKHSLALKYKDSFDASDEFFSTRNT